MSTHAGAAPAACGSCGHNLIRNPGAEDGKGTTDDSKEKVPFWTAHGNFTAASYRWSDGDLNASTPGPRHHGRNYFYGGPAGPRHATGTQVIAISRSGIGGGHVTFKLSGWLGGYASQTDEAILTATFDNAHGKPLAEATIGPVTAKQRNDDSALLYRSTSGKVPKATTTVTIVLDLIRHDVSDDDGMADNLALTLTQ